MGTPTMVFSLTLETEGGGSEHTTTTETFGEKVGALETEALHSTEQSNPILPVGPELIWGAACFIVLWALMKFVLLKPVVKIMSDREAKVNGDVAAAEEARGRGHGARRLPHGDERRPVRGEPHRRGRTSAR